MENDIVKSKILESALRYGESGLSVLAASKEEKNPAPVVGPWSKYQKKIAPAATIKKWFGNGNMYCVAVIGGQVSGNLEIIDFDERGEKFEPFMQLLKSERPDLAEQLVIEKSQSGGYHIFYRCTSFIPGNRKLTQRFIETPKEGEYEHNGKKYVAKKIGGKCGYVVVPIETRGEGGYCLCDPSPGYEIVQGSISDIRKISGEDRNYLINIARSFNEYVEPSKISRLPKQTKVDGKGLTPWDDYNAKTKVIDLLTEAGWTITGRIGRTQQGGETILLRRPGKKNGHSGSVIGGELFYNFSANAAPFEVDKAYSAFAVFALLNHGGDYREAGRELYKLGFGDRQKEPVQGKPAGFIERFNEKYAVTWLGSKSFVMYESTDPTFNRPDLKFLPFKDFENYHQNKRTVVAGPNGKARDISIAKAWLQSENRREYEGIVFDPTGKSPKEFYNLYQGMSVEPKKGDWSKLQAHIRENICDGNELHFQYLLAWMCDLVQNPGGPKSGVSIVLKGEKGTGKGFLVNNLGTIFGNHYLHLTQQNHLTGKFNNHLKNAILVFADECFWAGDKTSESVLKGMITEETFIVEQKGKDAIQLKNNVKLVIASNEDWVVPTTMDERRFFVLNVSSKHKQDFQYFSELEREARDGGVEAMLYDLLHYSLEGVNLRDVPRTEALFEQIVEGFKPEQRFWYNCLQRGSILNKESDWKASVITQELYQDYLNFCDDIGHRSYRLCKEIFSRKIRHMAPEVHSIQIRTSSMGRVWGLLFCDLDKCREYFEEMCNCKIRWMKLEDEIDA